ncbi:hypothetical protein ZHAS_00007634 [Anopheles sinensis]|uniref:Uncharacterized protein n=1 Tax=Anopheles sinensis TaxID=74873 RepID=A0A084VQ58_ANOSI|nr:hypothetical protein ZHAS_00007634 [Anopheles sinensis]
MGPQISTINASKEILPPKGTKKGGRIMKTIGSPAFVCRTCNQCYQQMLIAPHGQQRLLQVLCGTQGALKKWASPSNAPELKPRHELSEQRATSQTLPKGLVISSHFDDPPHLPNLPGLVGIAIGAEVCFVGLSLSSCGAPPMLVD